jgi:ABC transporter substrate binding protein (PQQ-dependent alcohol dehydrogenase system)
MPFRRNHFFLKNHAHIPLFYGILAAVFLGVFAVSLFHAGPVLAREDTLQQIEERKAWDEKRQKLREERRQKKDAKKKAAQKNGGPPSEKIKISFLTQEIEVPPALSNLDPLLIDEGIYGARLAAEDNNTTGKFLNQHYILDAVTVALDGDIIAAFKKLVADGHRHVVVNLPAKDVLALADLPEASKILIYNISAPDDSLRNQQCRANVLHTIPSRAMLADALAQFLIKKKWKEWFLVTGPREGDRLFAQAIKRAAKKFGADIEGEKTWDFTADIRRTAAAEVPIFTQGMDYDVLIVADEPGEFGEYLIWRTWDPRLVAGTQGLVPTAWHRTHERWGATQMQNRFRRAAGRWMTSVDYAAWIAVRSVGEAVTSSKSTDFTKVREFMLGPDFSLAAYKGIKVTYRPWNGQLRERILLAAPRSLVSVSPQKEFLHPVSEVDTLGYDKPESKCGKAG